MIKITCDWCGDEMLPQSTQAKRWYDEFYISGEPIRCAGCEKAWMDMQTTIRQRVDEYRQVVILEEKQKFLESRRTSK
jgi:hypothetical protein